MNEIPLFVDLTPNREGVTYTFGWDYAPCHIVSYRAHSAYGPEFDQAIRAAFDAGRRWARGQDGEQT